MTLLEQQIKRQTEARIALARSTALTDLRQAMVDRARRLDAIGKPSGGNCVFTPRLF